jgi:molybdopterin-guanine dinucleotide biosynthesis protein A
VTTGGIVLCGGGSSRMGRPKAWLTLAGEPMLCRVVRLLGQAVSPVVVVAAPGQELPALPLGVIVARDAETGRGPLQGLAAGLEALAGRAEAACATGCDAPFLAPAFVRRLVELCGPHAACAVEADGWPRPLPAVYRLGVLAIVRELLAAGQLRAGRLLERVPTRLVTLAELDGVDPSLASLRNLNTPEEYEAARREVEGPAW